MSQRIVCTADARSVCDSSVLVDRRWSLDAVKTLIKIAVRDL